MTRENLKNVDYSLKDIQEIFMNLFDKNTILMGHSLESDLKALKVSSLCPYNHGILIYILLSYY